MRGVQKVLKKCDNSPTEVARRVTAAGKDCKRQDVEYWVRRGYVPTSFAQVVESEFEVPLHELNPQVYPSPQSAA